MDELHIVVTARSYFVDASSILETLWQRVSSKAWRKAHRVKMRTRTALEAAAARFSTTILNIRALKKKKKVTS